LWIFLVCKVVSETVGSRNCKVRIPNDAAATLRQSAYWGATQPIASDLFSHRSSWEAK
jgi:hypothetical protein